MKEAWIELNQHERNDIWDEFYAKFDFHPSVKSQEWPGIEEPIPSITYSISSIYGQDEERYQKLNKDLQDHFLKYFQKLLGEDDWLFALDWQHNCYKFFPHIPFELNEWKEWQIPILPNGDYYIFLQKELEFGVFGHPWEQTMCIFGKKLIDLAEESSPLLLSQKIRVNGKIF